MEIRLLGAVQILVGDNFLPPFPTQRARELFASLATRPNQPQARAVLAGLLWPEKTEAKARASLNTELWRVRKVLGQAGTCLELTRDSIALNIPTDQIDIHNFRALAGRGDAVSLQKAVDLYRGEFLEGCYSDWCLLEREQLADLLRGALEGLLRHHEARGELSQAIAFAKRLNAYDPLREEIHRALMRLYIALGDRPAALAQYQTCKSALQRELGVEAMPETEALFQKIVGQADSDSSVSQSVFRPEKVFVGRAGALAWLDEAWAQTLQGNSRATLVMGESGIGKTRVIERWLKGLQEQAVILRGRCYEVDQQAAFHPIREMLHTAVGEFGVTALEELPNALLFELGRLLPDLQNQFPRPVSLAALPATQARERLLEALSAGLRAYATRQRPLILFCDDLQWADSESLDLIAGLIRSERTHPILLVASYRPDALAMLDASRVDEHIRRLGADSFSLEPLSKPETVELIRNMGRLADAPSQFAEQVYAETEGNPLFVIETLRGLFDSGYLAIDSQGIWAIPLDRQRVEAIRLPLPATLRDVIRKRVERLTAEQNRVLAVAAVIGREFDMETLLAISALEETICRDAVRILLRNRIIGESMGRYDFSHVRVQEFLLDGLEENQRRALHIQAAHFIESRVPVPLEQLASHYRQAGELLRALTCLQQAAERDMRLHAYKVAASHLETALSLFADSTMEETRFDLLMKLYACLWATDHELFKMEMILEQAMLVAKKLGDEDNLAQIYYQSGVNSVSQGRWEQARELLEKSIEYSTSRSAQVRMQSHIELSNILQYMHQGAQAKAHAEKSLALAIKLKDIRIEERARWDLAQNEMDVQGQAQIGLQIAQRAFETDTPSLLIDLGSSIVGMLLRAGNPGAALEQAERFLAFGREQGIHAFVKTVQRAQARVYCELGEYEKSLALAKESLAASRLTSYRYGEMRALACIGLSNAGLGHFDDALSELTHAASLCAQISSKMDLAALQVEIASLLLRTGEPAHRSAAEALTQQVLAEGYEIGFRGSYIFALCQLAQIQLAAGRPEAARQSSALALALMEDPENRDTGLEPRVYFTHFSVLKKFGEGDERIYLQRARQALYCRAKTLPAHLRRSYLRRVALHREITSSP